VGVLGSTVVVNQGGEMDRSETEEQASGTDRSSWYYAAGEQRLIIKVVP
jgi:hypothetical protein